MRPNGSSMARRVSAANSAITRSQGRSAGSAATSAETRRQISIAISSSSSRLSRTCQYSADAARVVAAGRYPEGLARLPGLGADAVILIEADELPLSDVAKGWQRPATGRRLVFVP
jgi:hypothetical protein